MISTKAERRDHPSLAWSQPPHAANDNDLPVAANDNDNLGRRTAFARANGAGASTTYGYDGMSRLASLSHGASGTTNDVTFGYSYNPASQITGRTVSNAAYEWGVPADFSDAYTADNLNQIATKDGASFNYDNRGNTVDDATKTYSYDYENRMAAGGGGTESYDPAGRLYQIVSGGVTQRFLYAGAQIVAEYNQSNVLQRRFAPGGLDEPLVWLEGTGTSNRKWLLADERGSIVAHANASAGVTAINRYDPFGVQPAGGANTGRFRYAGAPWIGSAELHHMRARTYSAENGRFMQPDPIGYAGGMNLYGYVGNDPVNFTDPWGLAWGDDVVGVTGTRRSCSPGASCISGDALDYYLQNPIPVHLFDTGDRGGYGGDNAGGGERVSSCGGDMGGAIGGSCVVYGTRTNSYAGPYSYDFNLIRFLSGGRAGTPREWIAGISEEMIGCFVDPGCAYTVLGPAGAVLAPKQLTSVGSYYLTDTVAAQAIIRPYINSPSTIAAVLSGTRVADPQGRAGLFLYTASGTFRGSTGTYELLYNPSSHVIYHFLFRSGPG